MADQKNPAKGPPKLPDLSLSDPDIQSEDKVLDLSEEITPLPVQPIVKKETAPVTKKEVAAVAKKEAVPAMKKTVSKPVKPVEPEAEVEAEVEKKDSKAREKVFKEERATEKMDVKQAKGPYHFVHLIRHGQYVIDKKQDDFGFLSGLGQRQSQLVAEKLREFPLRTIHSSDHARALETAKIIQRHFPDLEVKESHLLSEGIPWYPAKVRREKGLSFWTLRAHRKRMDQAFREYFAFNDDLKDDLHEVIITHGNVIRYFLCLALEVDITRWTRFEIANCSITTVRVDPTGIKKLIRFGEIGHIPLELRTIT